MIAVRGWQHLALAINLALGVSSSAAQVNPVRPGEIIEMSTYVVTAPAGNGWNIQKDQVKGLVLFQRDNPLTVISVVPSPMPESNGISDEDKVAAMIFDFEEKNMRDRGVSRSYTPSGFTRDLRVVSGKTVHVMRYSLTQLGLQPRLNPLVMKYVMYLYLPGNWRESKRAYAFIMGAPQMVGSTSSALNLEELDSLVRTFEAR